MTEETKIGRDDLINKFLQIESLAHRGKNLMEIMDRNKIVMVLRQIRKDLIDLETVFGRRIE